MTNKKTVASYKILNLRQPPCFLLFTFAILNFFGKSIINALKRFKVRALFAYYARLNIVGREIFHHFKAAVGKQLGYF